MPPGPPTIHDATAADPPRVPEINNHAISAIWTFGPTTPDAHLARTREWAGHGFPVPVAEQPEGGFTSNGASGPWEEYEHWDSYKHTVEPSDHGHPAAGGRERDQTLPTALIAPAQARRLHATSGVIETGNWAHVAPHKRSGLEETGVSRGVGRTFGRWLDLVFMREPLSRSTPD